MFWLYKVALAQEQSKIEEKSDGSDKFSACSFMFRAHFHVLYLSCHLQQEHLPNVIFSCIQAISPQAISAQYLRKCIHIKLDTMVP